jgi:hypothetical protein
MSFVNMNGNILIFLQAQQFMVQTQPSIEDWWMPISLTTRTTFVLIQIQQISILGLWDVKVGRTKVKFLYCCKFNNDVVVFHLVNVISINLFSQSSCNIWNFGNFNNIAFSWPFLMQHNSFHFSKMAFLGPNKRLHKWCIQSCNFWFACVWEMCSKLWIS